MVVISTLVAFPTVRLIGTLPDGASDGIMMLTCITPATRPGAAPA